MINLKGNWKFPQTEAPAGGFGYAFYGRNTNGGDDAELVQISTAAAFIEAIGNLSPLNIDLTANIAFDGGSGQGSLKRIKSNKTVRSANGRSITGISIWLEGVSNVKFENLVFGNVGYDMDAIHLSQGAAGVFINHCNYGATTDYWTTPPAEGSATDYDGIIDADQFEAVTIANSRVFRYDKCFLMYGYTSGAKRTGLTMYRNYFGDLRQRVPSVYDMDLHMFNNYSTNTRGGAQIGIRNTSRSLIHGNYYDDSTKIMNFDALTGTTDPRFLTDNTFATGSVQIDATGSPARYADFNPPYTMPALLTPLEAKNWCIANSGIYTL